MHAQDLAKGILLAQRRQDPSVDVRGVLDTNAMLSLTHPEKVEALRAYATMENIDPYKSTVNVQTPIHKDALGSLRSVIQDSAKAGLVGGGAAIIASPKALTALTDGGAKAAVGVLRKLRKPVAISAMLGGALKAISEVSEVRGRRKYMEEVQDTLEEIRGQENPNPYINALILSNRAAMRDAKLTERDTAAAHQSRLNMAHDVVDMAGNLSPDHSPYTGVITRSLKSLTDSE